MTAGLTLGYAAVLVGLLPFWLATTIFVGAFVLIFEWQGGRGGTGFVRRAAAVAGFALVVGVSVSVLFEEIFLVRLP
jgi:putative tricarboxylic transport membrane protein